MHLFHLFSFSSIQNFGFFLRTEIERQRDKEGQKKTGMKWIFMIVYKIILHFGCHSLSSPCSCQFCENKWWTKCHFCGCSIFRVNFDASTETVPIQKTTTTATTKQHVFTNVCYAFEHGIFSLCYFNVGECAFDTLIVEVIMNELTCSFCSCCMRRTAFLFK